MAMQDYKFRYKIVRYPDPSTMLKHLQAEQWCREQFGEQHTGRWGAFTDGFNFNDERDYIHFLLKWGNDD